MYPYKVIHCNDLGCYESYEYDGTLENEIYIACDKKIHDIPTEPNKELYNIIDNAYTHDSCGCCDAVNKVIFHCTRDLEYKHIQLISECIHVIRKNYALYF